jgi:hypothetical protein
VRRVFADQRQLALRNCDAFEGCCCCGFMFETILNDDDALTDAIEVCGHPYTRVCLSS